MKEFLLVLFLFLNHGFVTRIYSTSLFQKNNEEEINPKNEPICLPINEEDRMDCYPKSGATASNCQQRGCCWNANTVNKLSPSCYFGKNYGIYKVDNVTETNTGITIILKLENDKYSSKLITKPIVEINYICSDKLNIKIYDYLQTRFQVPLHLNQSTRVDTPNYKIHIETYPFALIVTRKSDKSILFDTRVAPLIFEDQFLSISTAIAGSYLHGIGERWGPSHVPFEWNYYSLFNSDHLPRTGTNGYGTHPFFTVSDVNSSYGVLFYNSNAQEFVTQPSKKITWRSIGGIFDIFLFLGPSPLNVMRQYTALVGRSVMPPYWSLGFHVCKYGYKSTDEVRDIVGKLKAAGIPQDGQWVDIDYMDKHRQLTYSWDGFGDLSDLVDELKSDDIHNVIISEPHVSTDSPLYLPYSDGLEMQAFVRDYTNQSFIEAKSWPGNCCYIDYGGKNGSEYWTNQLQLFHRLVKFDGLWIDMNDPSTFSSTCKSGKYNYPDYVPHNIFYHPLFAHTLCMDAIHTRGIHYDIHSIYGTLQAKDTYNALKYIKENERPFIISRSSFVSHGSFSGTWSGDISSNFDDMKNSISSMIRMNMFGISLTGSDICGFGQPANEDLCTRWYLLGAFYPFMRNHATHRDKTPFAFGDNMESTVKKIILERYRLLPFLYTLFYVSNTFGDPVIQPLFMGWNYDLNTFIIEDQFTWGSVILFSPAFDITTVVGYFPKGIWYDYWHENAPFISNGQFLSMETPLDKINIHVFGGNIIPVQKPATRTSNSRKNSFGLLVYANSTSCDGILAKGQLFWDDGISLETYNLGIYNLFDFTLGCFSNHYELTSVVNISYNVPMMLSHVEINGVNHPNGPVYINGVGTTYLYHSFLRMIIVDTLNSSLLEKIIISWT